MMRRAWLTMAAVAAVGAMAGGAYAVPCTSDADCGEGQYCAVDDVPCATPACPPGEACPEPPECAKAEGVCADVADLSECQGDADCPAGFTCDVVGGMACACPDGAECPGCGEPVEIYGCVPAPCQTDADCGEGLVCVEVVSDCGVEPVPMPDCAPGQECPEPKEPEPCEPEVERFCGPKWLEPCSADADCGAGFTCKPEEVCSCSGGGGTETPPPVPGEPSEGGGSSGSGGSSGAENPPDGGSDEPPMIPGDDEGECTCEPTGVNRCEPQEIPCAADGDCPAGWTCEAFGGGAVTCAVDPDDGGTPPECDTTPVEPEKLCAPPGLFGYGSFYGDGEFAGYPVDDKGTGGSGTNGPQDPRPSANEDAAAFGGSSGGTSGCGGGTAPLGSGLVLLSLLVAVATLRRRAPFGA